ncbi:alpha-D-ribose 1-methylphosphonate 5-triphosphate diphosphatase [Pseudodesulfovibrio sp.]|uniref:alpha-D-ribose 1-methylphosphonate 5-triphosphate diphosphatase n=1 Tax=unclassified Pseudodesulfovibrio TaxID=2661612 RepID=UPI003B009E03
MKEMVLRNGLVVTEGEVVAGSVVVRDGVIAGIDAGATSVRGALDLEGDYLIPGLIDVHTDSLERQFTPRPGVYWPSPLSAAVANDAMMHGCGITTVLDSICAEAFPEEETRRRMFNDAVRAVTDGEAARLFRSRHLLHLRCETADPKTPAILGEHLENPLVRLVSLMDHTPGQRQYKDENKFRQYYSDMAWTDSEFAQVVERLKDEQARYAEPQRAAIIGRATEHGIPLASHDDATPEHVAEARAASISISEFPTTLEAAFAARKAGMAVVMGAPNIVLGGSHSGNVSALEVLDAGQLTVLASDYVPASLLLAPFLVSRLLSRPLPDCMALVSANPAAMLGLDDRGVIAPGRLADLVRVRMADEQPVPVAVWTGGAVDAPAA